MTNSTLADYTRDPLALAMFAAWMNVRPDQVPPEYLGHTNPHTMAAWKRVGEAAIAFVSTPPTSTDERKDVLEEAANDHCTCAEVYGEDTDWALENTLPDDWQNMVIGYRRRIADLARAALTTKGD